MSALAEPSATQAIDRSVEQFAQEISLGNLACAERWASLALALQALMAEQEAGSPNEPDM